MKKIILILFIYFINHSVFATVTKKAYFAGGCFWCIEAVFEGIIGVEKVVSGYAGGKIKNPSYKEVSRGLTEHAEVCEISYTWSKLLGHAW